MDLRSLMEETRENVGNLMGWIIVVTLHQEYGIGKARLETIFREIAKINDKAADKIREGGNQNAVEWLSAKLVASAGKSVETNFRLPVTRAPKNRTEEQLRIAGNQSAQMIWLIYALGIRAAVGWGSEKLNRLRDQVWKNYEQLNEWNAEDRERAMNRLKIMAEAAIRESLSTVEGKTEHSNPVQDRLYAQEALNKMIQNARREIQASRCKDFSILNGVPMIPLVEENGVRKFVRI